MRELANEWNFDQSDPQSDYCHVNFHLHVGVELSFPRTEVDQEIARIKAVYQIQNITHLNEVRLSADVMPLTEAALKKLSQEFKDQTKKPFIQPQAVYTAITTFVEMVRSVYTDGEIFFDEGPIYWRVVWKKGDRSSVLCFVCRSDGRIYKARSWRSPALDSDRGTVFQATPFLFGKSGLISKGEYRTLQKPNLFKEPSL